MRKNITQEQIDSIIQAFFDCNAPVKMYAAVKDMLEKLPVVEIVVSGETKEVPFDVKDLDK